MIPLIDLQIRDYIASGFDRLKRNPDLIDTAFCYASEQTREGIRSLVNDKKVHLLTGYPRKETSLPAIIIQIAPEEETAYGLGEGIDDGYKELRQGRDNYLSWQEEGDSKYVLQTTKMNAQVNIEIWSDSTVITSLLYAIVKYCMLSERDRMQRTGGIELPYMTGGDLEPAPEYFETIFIYRRAVVLNFSYYIDYPVAEEIIGDEPDHFPLGTTIDKFEFDIKGIKDDGKERDEEDPEDIIV